MQLKAFLKDSFNPPNLLSLFRLLSSPLAIFLLSLNGLEGQIICFFIICVLFLTDYFDGFLARLLQKKTEIGRVLDPLADKTLMLVFLLGLVLFRDLPIWVFFLMLARDVFILVGGLILKLKQKLVPESNLWGKASTFVLMISFLLFIFPELTLASYLILIAGLVLALISFFSYLLLFAKAIKEKKI